LPPTYSRGGQYCDRSAVDEIQNPSSHRLLDAAASAGWLHFASGLEASKAAAHALNHNDDAPSSILSSRDRQLW
jgi:hypothetical protein